jgi:thioredoxin-dependent peroxiredoxin
MNKTLSLLFAALGYAAGSVLGAKGPEAGDVAPPFTLTGSDGKTYSLADHQGKRAVALAWFPKAFTSG